MTVESLSQNFEKVIDFTDPEHPTNINDSMGKVMSLLSSSTEEIESNNNNSNINNDDSGPAVNVNVALNHVFPSHKISYDSKDVILYNLSVGAAASNPTHLSQLKFAYENSSDFCAVPTIGN